VKAGFTYSYQQTGRYFAQIADEMEDLGAAELAELGAEDVHAVYRGIHFAADKATLYRLNYESRLVSKFLAPLMFCPCRSDGELYEQGAKIPWVDLFSAGDTFAVFSNVSHSNITHSKYAALRLKDAIVDQFREERGRRPNVDTKTPDVWIHVFVQNNKATISLETAGGALHRRGYKEATLAAPMSETLAAAIIRLTEWDGTTPLHDPMCGSGTLLCEALMHHCRIPPAFFREHFGFEHLPDFDRSVWGAVRKQSDGRTRELPPGLISGSDVAAEAVEADHRLQSAGGHPHRSEGRDGRVHQVVRRFPEAAVQGLDRVHLPRRPAAREADRPANVVEEAAQERRPGRPARQDRVILSARLD